MNIDELYRYCQGIANKEQKGFFTPEQFNLFCKEAQLAIVNDYLQQYLSALSTSDDQRQADTLLPKELLPLLSKTILSRQSNRYPLPVNYMQWVNIWRESGDKIVTIPLLDEKRYRIRAASILLPPTEQYPIAVLYSTGIEIKPSFPAVELSYIRYPNPPVWAYTVLNDEPRFQPLGSVDLELPPECHTKVAMLILQNLGVAISEQPLTEFSLVSAKK